MCLYVHMRVYYRCKHDEVVPGALKEPDTIAEQSTDGQEATATPAAPDMCDYVKYIHVYRYPYIYIHIYIYTYIHIY